MQQIRQLVFIPLFVLFCLDASVFAVDILSGGNSNDESPAANDVTWSCESNDDCTAANSTCIDRLCQCAPGYIYNAGITACLKVATMFYDSCEETLQCSAYLLSGAECMDNVCVCGPGYYYLHGRCNRHVGLFEKCKKNAECYVNADFEASTCDGVEGVCKCSTGFYMREYRTCRREGKAVGDECTVNIDCSFDNALCFKYACAVNSFFASEETDELASGDASTFNDSTSEGIRVGSNCTNHEQCESALKNASCDSVTGTCRCDRAYFPSNTGARCIPELGESCKSNDVANIENSICRNGRWSCTNGTVVSRNNRECSKAARKHKGKCERDEQCYVLGPDAVCNDKKCVCNEKSHYVKNEVFCWINKEVGETCIRNEDCYVKDFKGELTCKSKICSCPDGTHLNKNKTACINKSTGLGDPCEMDEDCAIPHAVCREEACACAENYFESGKQCLAGINTTCTNNEDCKSRNSACISEICSCKPNHVFVAANSCMPTLSYGESCSVDIQCSTNVPDAICVTKQSGSNVTDETKSSNTTETENKVCACSAENQYKYGKCVRKKLLGEKCATIGECYLNFNEELVMCMNGKCTCDWGYAKKNDSVCTKSSRSVFLPNGSVSSTAFTGLLSMILFVLSCRLI